MKNSMGIEKPGVGLGGESGQHRHPARLRRQIAVSGGSASSPMRCNRTGSGAAAIAKAFNAALLSGFAAGQSYSDIRTATGNAFRAPSIYNIVGPTHTPQFQEWNLQVRQAVTKNTSLTVNYFGTHGIHIPVENYSLNAYDKYGYGAGFPAAAPDASYGTVYQYSTSGISNSNGLTATFQGRFGHGLTAQASYTWSHALDEVSNGGVNVYGNDSIAGQVNPLNLRANNYGNADYDVRHSLSAYFVWALPFQFSNKVAQNLLAGWTVSDKLFGRSSLPYTVLDGNAAFAGLPVICRLSRWDKAQRRECLAATAR